MKKNIAAFAVIGAIVVPTLAHSEEHCRIFDGGLQSPMQRAATVSPHRQPSLLSSPLPAAVHQPAHYREIPIAFAAPPCLTPRGFLPWFGSRPRCLPRRCDGPASETLLRSGSAASRRACLKYL